MARCAYCQKETEWHNGGTPLCVECSAALASQHSIASGLQREAAEASARAGAANAAFHGLMREVPSSTPHPDGSQRLIDASRELTLARQAMMEAALRLHDFLNHGTIPEDLKR